MGRPSRTIESVAQELLQKSLVSGECHECHLATDTGGYGQTYYGSAHRVVWEGLFGPTKLCVLHTCDNRRCINPNHLFIGTIQGNVNDMIAKGRKVLSSTLAMTEKQRELAIRMHNAGYNYIELAEIFKVSKNTIWRNLNGQYN